VDHAERQVLPCRVLPGARRPPVDEQAWKLEVPGLVKWPLTLTLGGLKDQPSTTSRRGRVGLDSPPYRGDTEGRWLRVRV
jgi:hypothetical protein